MTGAALVGAAAVLVGALALKGLRRLGLALLLGGVLVLTGALALALYRQLAATHAAANAAVVASAAQSATGVAVVVLTILLVVVLLASGAAVLYLLYCLRRAESRTRWLPGPNARWEQAEPWSSPGLPWDSLLPPSGCGRPSVPRTETRIVVVRQDDQDEDLAPPWGWEDWL